MYNSVMVIDDNAIDRYIAEICLKKNEFTTEVISKESGDDALDYLKTNADAPHNLPQLIFLDINMPGMNGFEFLEAYELLPVDVQTSCIIVMLSSSLNPDDHKRVADNKFVSMFLNKPLLKEKLAELAANRQRLPTT
jgi:CheY-like chemotaxis protein